METFNHLEGFVPYLVAAFDFERGEYFDGEFYLFQSTESGGCLCMTLEPSFFLDFPEWAHERSTVWGKVPFPDISHNLLAATALFALSTLPSVSIDTDLVEKTLGVLPPAHDIAIAVSRVQEICTLNTEYFPMERDSSSPLYRRWALRGTTSFPLSPELYSPDSAP